MPEGPLVRQGVHHQRLDAAGEGDVTIVPGAGRIIKKAVPLFLCDVPLCKVGSLDMGQVFFDVQDQFQLLRSVVPPSTVIFLSVMRLPLAVHQSMELQHAVAHQSASTAA